MYSRANILNNSCQEVEINETGTRMTSVYHRKVFWIIENSASLRFEESTFQVFNHQGKIDTHLKDNVKCNYG